MTAPVRRDVDVLRSASTLPQPGDWTDADGLRALQDRQLGTTLEWAARSPFYAARGHGVRPGDDREALRALPLTTKSDLRAQYPWGMLAVPARELATYHESSGSAGQPTPSYYTESDWVDLLDRYCRKWLPMGPDDVFLVRTPYALMVSGHLAQAAARSRGATVVPGDNRSLATPCERIVRVLHDLDATLSWSMAQETLLWAAAAQLRGWDPRTDFPKQRALYVGGDALNSARRARIEEIWGVPVVEEYGSTETGSLAGACPVGELHLWADRAIFEVYDPRTGTISEDGSGQLVVTPLFRQAMPLLRYNLEDDVTLTHAPCACGWGYPRVRVYGRSAFAVVVDGATVTQDALDHAVFTIPATEGVLFWRARVDAGTLRIQIERGETTSRHVGTRLSDLVHERCGVTPVIEVLDPGALVPHEVLTGTQDVVKPQPLALPGQDWDKAITYH